MLNITLPNQVLTFVEERTTADGFKTPSDYIYHLILQEQERLAQRDRVELLLLEGLDSGEPVEVTDDWWNLRRIQLEELHQPKV